MTRVERLPCYFGASGAPLFGWLQRCPDRPVCQRGVIICPPTGHEQIHAHRSLRHLADALTEAGFPVLRFDYHGTGDSAGSDHDPDRYTAWLNSVISARQWMLGVLGCVEVSAVGVRLGAALAVQAACQEPFADLVLWAPVVKGRAFVREMKALSMAGNGRNAAGLDLEPAGFVITEQTAQALEAIDLLKARPQCRRVLIVDRDDVPGDAKLLDYLRSAGIDAAHITAPGYARMMAEPHLGEVPTQALAAIVAWMQPITSVVDRDLKQEFLPQKTAVRGEAGEPLCERALWLSREPDVFGTLCEPAQPVDGGPTILLLNAGAAYRVGPNRLHVLLARSLAAAGVPCLRIDLHGLGDSVTADAERENDSYPATAFRDIDLAMKYLRENTSANGVVLMGLCSGAYFTFQSLAQFADPFLVAGVAINPLAYYWGEGMTIQAGPNVQFQAYRDGLASARSPSKWLKLLTGRSKMGVAGAVRTVLERWRRRRSVAPNAIVDDVDLTKQPGHTGRDDVPGDLAKIARRGRPITFIFSRADPGYDMLTFHAADQVKAMCQSGQMRIIFIEEADHTFSREAWRAELVKAAKVGTTLRVAAGSLASGGRKPPD